MSDKDPKAEPIEKAINLLHGFRHIHPMESTGKCQPMPYDDYLRAMISTSDLPIMTVGDGDRVIDAISRVMASERGVPSFVGLDMADTEDKTGFVTLDSLGHFESGVVRIVTSGSRSGMAKLATIALAGDPYHIPPVEVIKKVERPRQAGSKHTQSKVPIAYTESVGPPGERRVNKKAKAKNRAKNKAARRNRRK